MLYGERFRDTEVRQSLKLDCRFAIVEAVCHSIANDGCITQHTTGGGQVDSRGRAESVPGKRLPLLRSPSSSPQVLNTPHTLILGGAAYCSVVVVFVLLSL
jgi:hypothetical protein